MSEDSAELETESTGADVPDETSSVARASTGVRTGSSVDRRPGKAPVKHGFFERTAQFLRDTRSEMRRVSWPNANTV